MTGLEARLHTNLPIKAAVTKKPKATATEPLKKKAKVEKTAALKLKGTPNKSLNGSVKGTPKKGVKGVVKVAPKKGVKGEKVKGKAKDGEVVKKPRAKPVKKPEVPVEPPIFEKVDTRLSKNDAEYRIYVSPLKVGLSADH